MSEAPSTPRANRLWASLIVEELIRSGVSLFCIAPGSRSTPLAAAVAENPPARALIHFDERGTAFAALGHARATNKPAAWITTSGTAVANGFPAIVEAATDGVPMLLLTADRPPELRQTGANQTIVQPGVFGEYVRWHFDLPAPDLSVDPASVLTTVDQAVYRALRIPRGPVHLNLMFREPFLPEPGTEQALPVHLSRWQKSSEPYTRYAATESAVGVEEVADLWESLCSVERGLIIAGRLKRRDDGEVVMRLAETLNWPLLADVGSQVRLGLGSKSRIAYYDALLASEGFAETHEPEAVLQFGGPPVSKRLQQFLARSRPTPYIVVRENPFRIDPNHLVTQSIESNVPSFCAALIGIAGEREPSRYAALWREASEHVDSYLNETFTRGSELSEPLVARWISHHIPASHGFVVASSMPVRDVDTFAATDGANVPVAANRGASGIDGTVATAAGFARGGIDGPVTLLIGDLALLHDLNSLAMLRELPVVVVILNNDGGGIFEFLPVAEHRKFFEPYFGTPQGVSFEPAAAMFGLAYECPRTVVEFEESYRSACERDGSSIIEVRTDRKENVALHRKLMEGISASIPG